MILWKANTQCTRRRHIGNKKSCKTHPEIAIANFQQRLAFCLRDQRYHTMPTRKHDMETWLLENPDMLHVTLRWNIPHDHFEELWFQMGQIPDIKFKDIGQIWEVCKEKKQYIPERV